MLYVIPLLHTVQKDLKTRFPGIVLDSLECISLLSESVSDLDLKELANLIDCLTHKFINLPEHAKF